jgi:hypothetical protein
LIAGTLALLPGIIKGVKSLLIMLICESDSSTSFNQVVKNLFARRECLGHLTCWLKGQPCFGENGCYFFQLGDCVFYVMSSIL